MIYAASNWYWAGTLGLYSSAAAALVAPTAPAYLAWIASGGVATPWPVDATGAQTAAALDAVLTAARLPASGLVPPTQAQLAAAVTAAAAAAANAVLAQIYTDPVHQAAGQNAAMIAAIAGGAPVSGSLFYAAFNGYATLFSVTPAALATLAITLTNESMALSVALSTVEAAASAATTTAQLSAALTAFETAISAVVAAVNAASPPVTLTAPAAISIIGVNA